MTARITAAEASRVLAASAASAPAPKRDRVRTPRPPELHTSVELDGGELELASATPAFWFTIPFALRSKSNFRRYAERGGSDNWELESTFEDSVAALAQRYTPHAWELGPSGPSSLPKRPKVVTFLWARTLLDSGNLSKSVLDACAGTVYHNDASVCHTTSTVERARSSQHGVISFAQVPAGTPLRTVLAVAAELAWATAGHISADNS